MKKMAHIIDLENIENLMDNFKIKYKNTFAPGGSFYIINESDIKTDKAKVVVDYLIKQYKDIIYINKGV